MPPNSPRFYFWAWGFKPEIASQAAHDLGIDCDILAPDRLSIHQPSDDWDWKDYHHFLSFLVDENFFSSRHVVSEPVTHRVTC
jgi:hypothetical protein